ncbi:FIG138056: a glutathione-dependent thiol reductase [hydrothermal vent metagenome]|uniref:FIG138056: a glutathione-dependent thiol reductase n=1 Tax=hydrothermal vent metagenome TaxID=652676 RepID=A0A3B1CYA2_9ZZZZ
MNIQILGRKNCNDTKKAQRFFKERRINFHFRDLAEKGLSNGELENICRSIDPEDLIDKNSKQYKKRGLKYMVFNIEEELLSDPLIIKTPIVRNGNKATVGVEPDVWAEWIKDA